MLNIKVKSKEWTPQIKKMISEERQRLEFIALERAALRKREELIKTNIFILQEQIINNGVVC